MGKNRVGPWARRWILVVAISLLSTFVPIPSSAATVFSDGFESGDLSAWSGSAGFVAQQTTLLSGSWVGRATANATPAHAWRTFSGQTELWSRVSFNITSRTTAMSLVSLRKPGGGVILDVGLNKGGGLIAKNTATGTTYSSGLVVSHGSRHELEIHLKIGSSGRFDVVLDGGSVPSLSQSTNLGTKPIGRFTLGTQGSTRRFSVAFDEVNVATDPGVADNAPPSQPTNLVATVVDHASVDLTWDPSTDEGGVTGYTVYRSTDGTTYTPVGTPSEPSFADSGLAPDTTYWWTVEATDGAGNISPRSEPATATTLADPSGTTLGSWTSPFEVGVPSIHAVVLFTGDVLLFMRSTNPTGDAWLYDPQTGGREDVSAPISFEYNMFCSAHILRPDGRVLVTGGVLWGASQPQGTELTAFFDPRTKTWTQGPAMTARRWYPTGVSLPNGDALVFSGRVDSATLATNVDRYDASTNSISSLPPSATLQMATYPRMFVLPDGRIVRVGQERQTLFFDPAAATWSQGPLMNHGSRTRGSVVLLPGLDRILAAGGATGSGPTTSTAEVLDLAGAQPSWQPTGSMNEPRRNFNLVLLPDGTVLAVGGNRGTSLTDEPVFAAELYDPATGTWTRMAEQTAPRAYHSTAVLLPDGRVLSAGNNDGPLQTTAEIYSPPYLFAGPRPTIGSAPTEVGYGGSFAVSTPQGDSIARVALIRGNSVTHGVSFDQRYVTLDFIVGSDGLSVTAPASSSEAPPGWYMLFLIDDAGVPSVAEWVHVS